jgi:hypothetical protein
MISRLSSASSIDPLSQRSRSTISPIDFFDPLETLSTASSSLARWRTLQLGRRSVPSFVLIGPRSGRVPIRLALMGGLHQTDSVSSTAIAKLLVEMNLASLFAQDYALFSYPVSNPLDQAGTDFEKDFWHGSSDPVVRFFESELATNELDGVIAVYGDKPISGIQFQASSRVLATEVLWPAVEVAQRFAPLAAEPVQFFPRSSERAGAFHHLDQLRPRPFCLAIHTPQRSAFEDQIAAIGFSLKFILHQYRSLVSEAGRL